MKTESSLEQKAQKALEESIIYYQGRPVGTVAARDPYTEALNYDWCFVRDFVSSALTFLMQGKTEIVRNFLSVTFTLQSCEKRLDCFKPGQPYPNPRSYFFTFICWQVTLARTHSTKALAFFWWRGSDRLCIYRNKAIE